MKNLKQLTFKKTLSALFFSFVFFGNIALGCDDTLLALLTSSDPNSDFSRGIREFNRTLSVLGASLKSGMKDDLDDKIQKVMESWMAFANRFNVNPPEIARTDAAWSAKMQEVAERIGRIRKLIQEGKDTEAHDEVLALSNRLGMFFENVGISDLKRRFLTVSEIVSNLESNRAAEKFTAMRYNCASLSYWLRDLKPIVTADAIRPFKKALRAVNELDAMLSIALQETNASDTITTNDRDRFLLKIKALTQDIDANILDLRARVLMREWFPPIASSPQVASQSEMQK